MQLQNLTIYYNNFIQFLLNPISAQKHQMDIVIVDSMFVDSMFTQKLTNVTLILILLKIIT